MYFNKLWKYYILYFVAYIPDPFWYRSNIVILPDSTRFSYTVDNILTINDTIYTIQLKINKIKFSYLNPNIVAILGFDKKIQSIALTIWDIVTSICLFTVTIPTRLPIIDFAFDLNTDNILVLLYNGEIKIFNTLFLDLQLVVGQQLLNFKIKK